MDRLRQSGRNDKALAHARGNAIPHALLREILSRIRALTNLRVVSDDASDTGYRVEVGPFPGWKKLPEW